ncbi:MAG TPA: YlbD family protein [Chondromyces sp.]|nr:YlbD family protein [Chondromyces sp.]
MAKRELHPSILEFKQFIKKHPQLLRKIKNEDISLQELFEEWYLFGEEDSHWEKYGIEQKKETDGEGKEKGSSTKWLDHMIETVKKMDSNQFQQHVNQINEAIGMIQGLLSQFQKENSQQQAPLRKKPSNPFGFRKD